MALVDERGVMRNFGSSGCRPRSVCQRRHDTLTATILPPLQHQPALRLPSS